MQCAPLFPHSALVLEKKAPDTETSSPRFTRLDQISFLSKVIYRPKLYFFFFFLALAAGRFRCVCVCARGVGRSGGGGGTVRMCEGVQTDNAGEIARLD